MLILISPAKTLDFSPLKQNIPFTQATFLKQAAQLMPYLQKQTPASLMALMEINPQLAELNFTRHAAWQTQHTLSNSKQAIFIYKGEVYRGLKAEKYSAADIDYAQNHLRILSGLYGILRPLDLIQPYRLEMGIQLTNSKGNNLYKFWGNSVTTEVSKIIKTNKLQCVINLASAEYSKVLNFKNVGVPTITPVFYENKNNNYKTIVVYAKKARGLMSSFIIKNRITNIDEIKLFDMEGYYFNPQLSDGQKWAFIRG